MYFNYFIKIFLPIVLLTRLCFFFTPETAAAEGKNPFRPQAPESTSEKAIQPERADDSPHGSVKRSYGSWLMRIALMQQKLKQKMTQWVVAFKRGETIQPLLMLLLIALGYGAVHAAGPGHGKAVATSYILSCDPSLPNGLLFGSLIALFHGFSGVVCVMALHLILRKGLSSALHHLSDMTQVISYSLITLLGCVILLKHLRQIAGHRNKRENNGISSSPAVNDTANGVMIEKPVKSSFQGNSGSVESRNPQRGGVIAWAFIVGMVPCPGVVTVMLFCLSMGLPLLGVAMAGAISMGMAFTISLTVIFVMMGKTGTFLAFSLKNSQRIEQVTGVVSGGCLTGIGLLFLMTALYGS